MFCCIITLSIGRTDLEIFDFEIYRDLETRIRGSLKVIENDTIRSSTHNFLLTFRSNHGPISNRFRDNQRFPSKIANFSHPSVSIAPLKGLPLELCIGAGSEETRMMGLPYGRKSFKIDLTV